MRWSEAVDALLRGAITTYTDPRGRIYGREDALACLGHVRAHQKGYGEEYTALLRKWRRKGARWHLRNPPPGGHAPAEIQRLERAATGDCRWGR